MVTLDGLQEDLLRHLIIRVMVILEILISFRVGLDELHRQPCENPDGKTLIYPTLNYFFLTRFAGAWPPRFWDDEVKR